MKALSIFTNAPAPRVYQGQRVLTLRDIDGLHGRPEGTARRNFFENKERLEEGIDYFPLSRKKLTYDLRTLGEAVENGAFEASSEIRTNEEEAALGLNIPNRGILVFTLTGYLMLVKSFTDEKSWQVQRELVRGYFAGVKQGMTFQGTEVATVQTYCLTTGENPSTVQDWFRRHYPTLPLGQVMYLEGRHLEMFRQENPGWKSTARSLWVMTRAGAELLQRRSRKHPRIE